MIEELYGREKVNPHAIADKVNEIIKVINDAEQQENIEEAKTKGGINNG